MSWTRRRRCDVCLFVCLFAVYYTQLTETTGPRDPLALRPTRRTERSGNRILHPLRSVTVHRETGYPKKERPGPDSANTPTLTHVWCGPPQTHVWSVSEAQAGALSLHEGEVRRRDSCWDRMPCVGVARVIRDQLIRTRATRARHAHANWP